MSKNPVMEAVANFAKKMRIVGIIISIVMIILGILALSMPARTSLLIAWLFLAGIVIYGVFDIVKFIKAPSGEKQPWTLVSGILSVVLGIVALLATEKAGKVFILSTALCFLMITTGVGRLTMAAQLRKDGKVRTGWMTASGVIDLVCAMFFITSPFIMTFAYEFVMGIYLVVGGVSLLVELLSDPPAKAA